jgi:hypothetical protein
VEHGGDQIRLVRRVSPTGRPGTLGHKKTNVDQLRAGADTETIKDLEGGGVRERSSRTGKSEGT